MFPDASGSPASSHMFRVSIITVDYAMAAPQEGMGDPIRSGFNDVIKGDVVRRLCKVEADLVSRRAVSVPVLRICGRRSSDGQSVMLKLHGRLPFLFIPWPSAWEFGSSMSVVQYLLRIALCLETHPLLQKRGAKYNGSGVPAIHSCHVVKGYPFYGYHDTPRFFVKIFVYDPKLVSAVATVLKKTTHVMGRSHHVYNAHCPFIMQCLVDLELSGTRFVTVREKDLPDASGFHARRVYDVDVMRTFRNIEVKNAKAHRTQSTHTNSNSPLTTGVGTVNHARCNFTQLKEDTNTKFVYTLSDVWKKLRLYSARVLRDTDFIPADAQLTGGALGSPLRSCYPEDSPFEKIFRKRFDDNREAYSAERDTTAPKEAKQSQSFGAFPCSLGKAQLGSFSIEKMPWGFASWQELAAFPLSDVISAKEPPIMEGIQGATPDQMLPPFSDNLNSPQSPEEEKCSLKELHLTLRELNKAMECQQHNDDDEDDPPEDHDDYDDDAHSSDYGSCRGPKPSYINSADPQHDSPLLFEDSDTEYPDPGLGTVFSDRDGSMKLDGGPEVVGNLFPSDDEDDDIVAAAASPQTVSPYLGQHSPKETPAVITLTASEAKPRSQESGVRTVLFCSEEKEEEQGTPASDVQPAQQTLPSPPPSRRLKAMSAPPTYSALVASDTDTEPQPVHTKRPHCYLPDPYEQKKGQQQVDLATLHHPHRYVLRSTAAPPKVHDVVADLKEETRLSLKSRYVQQWGGRVLPGKRKREEDIGSAKKVRKLSLLTHLTTHHASGQARPANAMHTKAMLKRGVPSSGATPTVSALPNLVVCSFELSSDCGNLAANPKGEDYRMCPEAADDAVTMVTMIFHNLRNGANEANDSRHLIALSRAEEETLCMPPDPPFTVHTESSERSLFERSLSILKAEDPDILIGWDMERGSFGYFCARAHMACKIDVKRVLSRAPDSGGVEEGDSDSDSSEKFQRKKTLDPHLEGQQHHFALGRASDNGNALSSFSPTGRVAVNMWRVLKKEIQQSSYTLSAVAKTVLGTVLPYYEARTLAAWDRDASKRSALGRYMAGKATILMRLTSHLDLLNRAVEVSGLYGFQLSDVLSRGSQYCVENMFVRISTPLGFLLISPSQQEVALQNLQQGVPLVMEPVSGLYTDPVIVLDFRSLYPSVIIAYNLCFSTLLGKVTPTRKKKIGAVKNYAIPEAFYQKATSTEEAERLKKGSNDVFVSPNSCCFVKPAVRKGVLPRVLSEVLTTRFAVQKALKKAIACGDDAMASVLNAQQRGLKAVANVTFGYTAASYTGRMPCSDVADSTVLIARQILEDTIRYVESEKRFNARVVYGDTDSLFVLVPSATVQQAFNVGKQIVAHISTVYPTPIKLKLEKVYEKCFLVTKKRYVGYAYESETQTTPKFDAKGIERYAHTTHHAPHATHHYAQHTAGPVCGNTKDPGGCVKGAVRERWVFGLCEDVPARPDHEGAVGRRQPPRFHPTPGSQVWKLQKPRPASAWGDGGEEPDYAGGAFRTAVQRACALPCSKRAIWGEAAQQSRAPTRPAARRLRIASAQHRVLCREADRSRPRPRPHASGGEHPGVVFLCSQGQAQGGSRTPRACLRQR